jgi:hypothetical protein
LKIEILNVLVRFGTVNRHIELAVPELLQFNKRAAKVLGAS